MSSYGLTPTELSAISADGKQINIHLHNSPAPSSSTSGNMSTADDRTARTLYLLDRFGVSDEFYHELAQVLNLNEVCIYIK